MAHCKNNTPPIFVDVMNAFIKHVIHPTVPECINYIINCLQNYIMNLQREATTDSQIYQAIQQFKWYPKGQGPPSSICNPLVFYKSVVQHNMEQSNTIATKAAKKAEKMQKKQWNKPTMNLQARGNESS